MRLRLEMLLVCSSLMIILMTVPVCAADTTQVISPRVVEAISTDSTNQAGMGDCVIVKVNALKSLLESASKGKKHIVLYLDDLCMYGVYTMGIDTAKGTIRFCLLHPDTSTMAWNSVLGKPKGFKKNIKVSVGLEGSDQFAIPTDVTDFQLTMIPKGWFWSFVVLSVLLLIGLFVLGRNTNLLRDGSNPPGGPKSPFSLSRCQMAWWFCLVVISYVFIWMITGQYNSVTGSVLILIGISSGTALGARLMNNNPIPVPQGPAVPPLQPPVSSGDLFKDILSDDQNSIGIHRFQIVVWTIVLGIMFCVSVYDNLSMPEFGGTLLTLMGISSGTYLGFKKQE